MNCEMCGNDYPRLKTARVEGSLLNVCANCVRFGEEVAPPRPTGPAAPAGSPEAVKERLAARDRRGATRDVLGEMQDELVDDFGPRIKKGREKKGWTREQLADHIKEPVSSVTKIEAGELHPSDRAIKAIERELGVKIMEPVPRSQIPQRADPTASRGLTLGDLIKDAKKKGQS